MHSEWRFARVLEGRVVPRREDRAAAERRQGDYALYEQVGGSGSGSRGSAEPGSAQRGAGLRALA
jgi:hypothetical protein